MNVNAATMYRICKVASELRVKKIELTDHQTSEDSCLIQTGFAAFGKGCWIDAGYTVLCATKAMVTMASALFLAPAAALNRVAMTRHYQ